MARRPRLCLPDQAHLLWQPAAAPVFAYEADYAAYVQRLADMAPRCGVQVHAYALLPDAVWLLVTPQDCAGLSRLMQSLARRTSREADAGGRVWQGRFRSAVLQASTWMLPALCAVDQAAECSGLVGDARDWAWSSLAHHTGQRALGWLREAPQYWELGNTPYAREAAFSALLDSGLGLRSWSRLGAAVRSGIVLGDAGFAQEAAQRLGRPVLPARRGRPPGRR